MTRTHPDTPRELLALASPVEILALKKIALLVGGLLPMLNSESAKTETRALLMVLMDVTGRIESHALVRAMTARNPAVGE